MLVRRATAKFKALVVVCTATGLILVVGSWLVESQGPFLPALLMETGVAFLLLAPLLWVQRRLEQEVDEVRHRVNDTRAELVQTEVRLNRLTNAERISAEVTSRRARSREHDETLFALVETGSLPAVAEALTRAVELRIASALMPRVPLFDTHYMVRFVPIESDGHTLDVRLESRHGRVVTSFHWSQPESPADLGERIGEWLDTQGQHPGDIAFHPGYMFTRLCETLTRAHQRMTGARGVTVDLAPVVQLCGDGHYDDYWWITDVGVQRDGELFTYTIPKERFHELDWDRHVTSRDRVDVGAFREAFETAKALDQKGLL